MSAGNYSLIVNRGATNSRQFRNLDINGNQVPFSAGSVANLVITSGPLITGPTLLSASSIDGSGRLTLQLSGVILLTLLPNDTAVTLLNYVNLLYNLNITLASGAIVPFLLGGIAVM